MQDESGRQSHRWQRPTWLAIVVIAIVAFSLAFACAMPLAAIATAAACTLPRRDAYSLAGSAWMANQVVGFTCLQYPLTWDCLAWGVVLGMSAMVAIVAASEIARRVGRINFGARIVGAFLTSFVAYEATLIVASLFLGGLENFTPAIQGRILGINALALFGLLVLDRAGSAVGIVPPVSLRLAMLEQPARG